MPSARVRFNHASIAAFLKSAAVAAEIEALAQSVAATANGRVTKRTNPEGAEPFAVAVHYQSRVVANVYTRTADGMLAEMHHRTLSKSLP